MAPNTKKDQMIPQPALEADLDVIRGRMIEGHMNGNANGHRAKESLTDADFAPHSHDEYDHVADFRLPTVSECIQLYKTYKGKIVWRNVILMTILHGYFPYACYLFFFAIQWKTFFYTWGLLYLSGFGITAGAHRLWAHKSYKARLPLRLFLTFCQTLAFQNDIYEWCRDHRVHHKFSETDADPHNAKRGFFFSHIGWLLVKKHPDVKEKGKTIDMSDLMEDPIIYYQRKYYVPIVLTVSLILPSYLPVWVWNENPWYAFVVCSLGRYCFSLNCTWLVNSAAHMWGNKPYDREISAVENYKVSQWVLGEGWHNYHHTFPWDYKTSELGLYQFNLTAMFIDFMARIGQAYDLKTVDHETIMQRVNRTGDGSETFMRHSDDIEPSDHKKMD
ncbi:unnamed protein product [Cyprideis torosa]|uniref:Fatty acid desaturase domain-containing protein n=1 Tax=Cyprideis torosa TaxID=163714 RepID=A0A7R8ZM77_9CRUS|nr:unnamed protein product [Cyprideis torosa]CAG0883720.1 unnamed protein product [Cyprideis torosa]